MFPPRDWRDIERYPIEDVIEGFVYFSKDDPPPGDNRSPGYRWGWDNAKRDRSDDDDGYDAIRQEFIRETRKARVAE
jgi:hypothetical protein